MALDDKQRLADKLQQQRAREHSETESKRRRITRDNSVKHSSERFVEQANSVETKLKLSTVGLVKLEEFQRIKEELEEERQRKAANTLVDAKTEEQPKKPKKAKKIAKLS
ncbi:hypothetical protein FBU59_006486, partial [Linderina macrospora]